MYDFERTVKHAMERHEERVHELQSVRQLPRNAQTNSLASAINAVKNAFGAQVAPKTTVPAPKPSTRLATK